MSAMSATCLSWAICVAACDCCFGWIRFCYWAGRGEGSDDCNVLNHVQSSAGLQQACLRFETRFFVWREVVQAVFCHRCHSSCQTLKDRGAWTLLDSKNHCPHSAAYHNIARWGEGGATWASASKPAGTASMTDVQVLFVLDSKMERLNNSSKNGSWNLSQNWSHWKGPPQSVFLVRRLDSCGRMFDCLDVLKLWKDEWLGFILSVGPEVFVSTSILKYEKIESKLAPILGAGKRLPKWESAPLLLQK